VAAWPACLLGTMAAIRTAAVVMAAAVIATAETGAGGQWAGLHRGGGRRSRGGRCGAGDQEDAEHREGDVGGEAAWVAAGTSTRRMRSRAARARMERRRGHRQAGGEERYPGRDDVAWAAVYASHPNRRALRGRAPCRTAPAMALPGWAPALAAVASPGAAASASTAPAASISSSPGTTRPRPRSSTLPGVAAPSCSSTPRPASPRSSGCVSAPHGRARGPRRPRTRRPPGPRLLRGGPAHPCPPSGVASPSMPAPLWRTQALSAERCTASSVKYHPQSGWLHEGPPRGPLVPALMFQRARRCWLRRNAPMSLHRHERTLTLRALPVRPARGFQGHEHAGTAEPFQVTPPEAVASPWE